MDNGKKMSALEVMSIGMRGYKEEIDYNWHGKMIKVRYMLSRDEEIELVHNILTCCGHDVNDGYLIPEFIDLAIRSNIVSAYAQVELPDSIDKQHQLLYYSDLYDVVLKTANKRQIDNIINSVKGYV